MNIPKEAYVIILAVVLWLGILAWNFLLGLVISIIAVFFINYGNKKIEDDKKKLVNNEEIEKELETVETVETIDSSSEDKANS